MKLKDFKQLQFQDKVTLNNGREAQIVTITKTMTGKYLAEIFYLDTFRSTFKTPRQIRRKKK